MTKKKFTAEEITDQLMMLCEIERVFNLFNRWYLGLGFAKYRFVCKDSSKSPIQFCKYHNIMYIGIRTKKYSYVFHIRFGKYYDSCKRGN